MEGNELVREFRKTLSALPCLDVARTTISRRNRVFQLDGQINGLIYVKAIAHPPHYWGITKNTVDEVKSQRKPWCVILLYDHPNMGYVISSSECEKRSRGLWPDAQGDFKISSGMSLKGIPKFESFDKLLTILSSVLSRTR